MIRFDVDDGVATITLSRPNQMNALNPEMLGQLASAWQAVRDRADIKVAILTGEGDRAFCAGADLKDLIPKPPPLAAMWDQNVGLRPDRGIELWKPVIGAVNGHCFGGGLTLLLATDIRLAVPTARFGTPEVRWGIIASCGGTQRLVSQIGFSRAMQMLLTGDAIDADTAERWGLVNKLVDPGNLLTEARAIADRIKRNAPMAVQATKELVLKSQGMSVEVGVRLEDAMERLLQTSSDIIEGSNAFSERREPIYKGE